MNTENIDIGLARYSDWAFTVLGRRPGAGPAAAGRRTGLQPYPPGRPNANWLEPRRRRPSTCGRLGRRRRRPSRRRRRGTRHPAGRARRQGRPGPGLPRHRAAVRLHRAARSGHPAGAVGQHVRVHQPDQFLRPARRRRGAAQAAVPVAVGVRAGAGAGPADRVGQVALHPRRAGDARAAVLLAADPRVGGQPRLRGVPGGRGGQHPVPAEDVEVRRAGTLRDSPAGPADRCSRASCPTPRPWTGSPTAPRSSASRCSASG